MTDVLRRDRRGEDTRKDGRSLGEGRAEIGTTQPQTKEHLRDSGGRSSKSQEQERFSLDHLDARSDPWVSGDAP